MDMDYLPEHERVVRNGIYECLGFSRVEQALSRLKKLKRPGLYIFEINTASHPLPFQPKSIELKRNELNQSTLNGLQQGSSYNNLSLSTIFEEHERCHTSVKIFLETVNIPITATYRRATQFMNEFGLDGNPRDFTSWTKYIKLNFHDKMNRYNEFPPLKGLFAAAAKRKSYFIEKSEGIVSLKIMDVASHTEIKNSLDKIFLAMVLSKYDDRGVVVPSLSRAFFIYAWLISSIVFITYASISGWSSIQLFSKDFFEALVFVSISVPALVQYISDEPEVIKNALRANKILWKNSQVKNYFGLNQFDYAVMGLINSPMWLVSNSTGSYLLRGGHDKLKGMYKFPFILMFRI